MSLLNQALNNLTLPLSESSVSLNTDIYETNLINLLILSAAIIYFLGDALLTSLSERKNNILSSLQEAEEQVSKAKALYLETTFRKSLVPFIVENVNCDGTVMAKKVKNVILTNGKMEIVRLNKTVKFQIDRIESDIYKELARNAFNRAFESVKDEINKSFVVVTSSKDATNKNEASSEVGKLYMDEIISQL